MDPQQTPKPPPRVLPYAEADRTRKPFSVAAFLGGLVAPYAYAAVGLFVVGLITSQPNGVYAFYEFEPPVLVALAAFPLVVWWVQRLLPYRGFIRGVVTGLVLVPVVLFITLMVAFRRGT